MNTHETEIHMSAPGNSLDELGIPKNPYFDPSYASVDSFGMILRGAIEW